MSPYKRTGAWDKNAPIDLLHCMYLINKTIAIVAQTNTYITPCVLDRDRKKSMISEWPADFSAYSRDKSKNFLLKKFLKILLPRHAHKQQRQVIFDREANFLPLLIIGQFPIYVPLP